jgi:hypothetical protein
MFRLAEVRFAAPEVEEATAEPGRRRDRVA